MIYLDYAATTPIDEEALQAMLPLLKENFGNPDSPHAAGRAAAYAVSEARARIAELLGVSSSEVYFTSGGTEANNWAVRCLSSGRAALSGIEHASLIEGAKLRRGGYSLIPATRGGVVTAEAVESALTPDTGLVSVMAVNNETGCVNPVGEIAALLKKRGIPFFSDCVQAQCLMDLKELALQCDALSLSAHKVYGPKGVGALIVKRGVKLAPLLAGGEQERSLRGGTLNAAGIAGFAAALCKAQREREVALRRAQELSAFLEEELNRAFGQKLLPDGENRLPCILHYTLPGGGSALVQKLDLKGVCVSGGAACASHSALPSHVMLAMGRSEEEARRGLRISFGRETTEEELSLAVKLLKECVPET